MASQSSGGYDYEFLDPPIKLKEFECPLCLLVTREPNLSLCCGQHFCQSCIKRIVKKRKPCPLCKENSFSAVLDKKQKRKVLQLKVRCSMKKRGCGWTGVLGELATHTDTRNGRSCQFVDVVCPNNCGETHQKRHLCSHVSETCPKRPFACEHCKFKSIYEVVCKHYDKCAKFPLECPNKCEIASVERGKMKEHLSECPLQLVECEYAYAGCSEKIQRKDLAVHMEQSVQKHLLWAFAASQKQIESLQQQIEDVRREKNEQLQIVQQQIEELRRETDWKLQEKDQQILLLKERAAVLEKHTRLPVDVEYCAYNFKKFKGTGRKQDRCIFYTHPEGAKVHVCAHFGNVRNVYIELYQQPGEFDNKIQWPLKCTVTVYLLNQLNDRDHICGSRTLSLDRPKETTYTGDPDPLKVPYTTLIRPPAGAAYVKDDCLKFKVHVEAAK